MAKHRQTVDLQPYVVVHAGCVPQQAAVGDWTFQVQVTSARTTLIHERTYTATGVFRDCLSTLQFRCYQLFQSYADVKITLLP
jgi:hypothetical protein